MAPVARLEVVVPSSLDALRSVALPRRPDIDVALAELAPRYLFLEPLLADRRVLEIGQVGRTHGESARMILARGARSVVALDPDPDAVAQAQHPPVADLDWVCGALSDVGDRAFDLVLIHFERVPDAGSGFVDRLARKVAPGGFLCASLRNPSGVTLAQVARGEEREAPATYGQLAEALQGAFPSIESAAQTVLLGYQIAGSSDEEPTLDGSLCPSADAAYYLFICGERPSHLGAPLLVAVPPAPVAVASEARQELREAARASARRAEEAARERDDALEALSEARGELERVGSASSASTERERVLRQQLDAEEERSRGLKAALEVERRQSDTLDAMGSEIRQQVTAERETAGRLRQLLAAADQRLIEEAHARETSTLSTSALESERGRLAAEIAQRERVAVSLRAEIEKLHQGEQGRTEHEANLRAQLEQGRVELDRAQELARRTEVASNLLREELRGALERIERERSEAQGQLSVVQAEAAESNARGQRLTEALQAAEARSRRLEEAEGEVERLQRSGAASAAEVERRLSELGQLRDQLLATAAERETLAREITALQATAVDRDRLRGALRDAEERAQRVDSELASSRARVAQQESETRTHLKDLEAAASLVAAVTSERDAQSHLAQELASERDAQALALAELETRSSREAQASAERAEEMGASLAATQRELEALRAQWDQERAGRMALESERHSLVQRAQSLEDDRARLLQREVALEAAWVRAQRSADGHARALEHAESTGAALQARGGELEQELRQARMESDEAQARANTQLAHRERELLEARAQLELSEGEVGRLERRCESMAADVADVESLIQRMEEAARESRIEVWEEVAKQRRIGEAAERSLRRQLEAVQLQLESTESELARAHGDRASLAEVAHQAEGLAAERLHLNQALDEAVLRAQAAESQNAGLAADLEQLGAQLREREGELAVGRAAEQRLEARVGELDEALSTTQAENRGLDGAVRALEARVGELGPLLEATQAENRRLADAAQVAEADHRQRTAQGEQELAALQRALEDARFEASRSVAAESDRSAAAAQRDAARIAELSSALEDARLEASRSATVAQERSAAVAQQDAVRISELGAALESARAESRSLAETAEAVNGHRERAAELERELTSTQVAQQETQRQAEEHRLAAAEAQEAVQAWKGEAEMRGQAADELSRRIEVTEADLVARLAAVESAKAQVEAQLAGARAALESAEQQGRKVPDLERGMFLVREDLDSARNELERLRSDRDQAQARLAASEKQRKEEAEGRGTQLELRAAAVREEALQKERERLTGEVEELKGLHHASVEEGHKLRVEAGEARVLRARLSDAEAAVAQRDAQVAGMKSTETERLRGLEQTKAQLIEQSARNTARSAAEARMYKELADRQSKELEDLRVQWARASTELERLKAAHQALQDEELGARSELKKLKEGKGILAASDLAEAMGVDLDRVRRLEQRIRELEGQLASRP